MAKTIVRYGLAFFSLLCSLPITVVVGQTTWITRPGNTTASINYVAYGNGLFMANNGTTAVLTSPDGNAWTTRPTSATASLRSNAFGNGQFVAVGYAGTIVTSPDALSWTSRVSGVGPTVDVAGLDLYGVAYGAGLFVVTGKYGLILTSPNGINWTVRVGTEAVGTIITSVNTPIAPKLPNKQATQSRPFTYAVPPFAGTSLTYAATNLPAGLSFDPATQIISGTPSTTGLSTVTITATNLLGAASASFVLTVNPGPILAQRVFTNSRIMGKKLLSLQNGEQLLIGSIENNDYAWVNRLSVEGNTVWTMQFGNGIRLTDAVETPDGGAVVAGSYIGAASLPVSLTTGDVVLTGLVSSTVVGGLTYTSIKGSVFQTAPSGADWRKPSGMLAMKLTASGLIEWIRILGPGSGQAICKADGSSFWLVGQSNGPNDTGDIQGHHVPACAPGCTNADVWAVKLNAVGTVLTSRFYGGSGSEAPMPNASEAIKGTADGGLIISVQTSGYVGPPDGDFTGTNSGGRVHGLLNINPDASVAWFKWLDYSLPGVAQTTDGGFVGVGSVGQSRFPGFNGFSDARVLKVTATGTTLWERDYGGNYDDSGQSIRDTPDGGCIFLGTTTSNNGDVSGLHTPVISDYWVVKLSGIGDIQFQRPFGSDGNERNAGSELFLSTMPDGTFSLIGAIATATGDVLTPEPVTNSYWTTVWLVNFFLPTVCPANTSISAQPGNWNTASTWACGGVPTATSTVQIKTGHVVTISSAVQASRVQFETDAKVIYTPAGRLVLGQ